MQDRKGIGYVPWNGRALTWCCFWSSTVQKMKLTYISYDRAERALGDHCTASPECWGCVSHPGLGQAWDCSHSLQTCACLSLFDMTVQQLGCFLWACTAFPWMGERKQGEGSVLPSLVPGMVIPRASRHFCIISWEAALEPWTRSWAWLTFCCAWLVTLWWAKPAVLAVWKNR